MNYVTPTNYLELVQGYMGMLKDLVARVRIQDLGSKVQVLRFGV